VKFTSSRMKMGPFVNRRFWAALAWAVAGVIIALNGKLVIDKIIDWAGAAGGYGWAVWATMGPLAGGLLLLLGWMTFRREGEERPAPAASAEQVAAAAVARSLQFGRIGVALDASDSDAAMLAEAVSLAKAHRAELVLMHVVEGVGGQWYGQHAGDAEQRHDEQYMDALAGHLRATLSEQEVPAVRVALGYGDVKRALAQLAREQRVDLIVAGGHGHRGLGDLLRGETISGLRHGVTVPVLAVRSAGR
jgi:manganese transport protein